MLSIENLIVTVAESGEPLVSEVTLNIPPGCAFAIVGESGSGKSTLLRTLTRIQHPDLVANGRVLFRSIDLLRCSYEELRSIRRKDIRYIFQEPQQSLNPVLTIGQQLALSSPAGDDSADSLRTILKKAGIKDPERVLKLYPHQVSIGMAQRIMVAMALLPAPSLIIADEPTSAVDVFLRVQLMETLTTFFRQREGAILFVTHDLMMARRFADHVAVLRAGRIVESADTATLFESPHHAYTKELVSSIPDIRAVTS